jgi:diacylglycerol kinase (ATP)
MFKKVHIILNPISGQDEPILSWLAKSFYESGIDWNISITKAAGDARRQALKYKSKADVIAIYGGDGSVMEVAQALHHTGTPMAIIPGGTANVLAKELAIPIASQAAINLLKQETPAFRSIDMGLVNKKPFVLRINMGILAEMVLQTNRELKNSFGQLAYGITTVQTLFKSAPVLYYINVDGEEFMEEGVALTVTNTGNIGVEGMNMLPDIDVSDGWLDVVLLKQADFLSVLQIATSTLLQTDSTVLKRWRGKNIFVRTKEKQTVIWDDCPIEAKALHIQVVPNALKILVPA